MNSKQKLIVTVCILLSTITHAQSIRFGLETGINIATLHITPKSAFSAGTLSSKAGLKLGGVLDIGLAKDISIETGLLYSRKGVKLSDRFLGQSFEVQYRYNYVEIPVYAKYKYKGLMLAVGPYIGLIAGASYKGVTVDTSFTEKISIGNDPNMDGVKRMDAGLNVKAGYAFPIGLCLFAQYGLGLSNTSPGIGFTAKNNVVCFSVGYYFGKHTSTNPKTVKSE